MTPERKYTMTNKKALVWAEQYDCVMNYLSKVNADRPQISQDIYLFCEWANKNPNELLALKSTFDNLDAERLLDKFVYSKVNMPDTKKWHIMMRVRGFFRANYRQLVSAAGKMEYPPAKAQRSPTKKKRQTFFNSCYTPRDRALVEMVSCSALALETLSKLRWYHFEEDWEQQEIPHISIPSDLLKGHGKGKYRGIRQETFITPECKKILLEYRDWFTKNFKKQWNTEDYVFLQTKADIGEPLDYLMIAKTMLRISERSGIKWASHDGRRIVQTALESVGCSANWIRKIKGRKVSGEESPYSRPAIEQLRQKYREALPELEFLNEQTPALIELSKGLNSKSGEIADLQSTVQNMQQKIEQLAALLYLTASSDKTGETKKTLLKTLEDLKKT